LGSADASARPLWAVPDASLLEALCQNPDRTIAMIVIAGDAADGNGMRRGHRAAPGERGLR
jgi:hypothetical protein